MTFRILLDAGHGKGEAFNRGSVIGNEGDNNYFYSLVLKRELEKYVGVEVTLTRPTLESNPSLFMRGRKGQGFDLLISLHSNAAIKHVRGIEIWADVDTNDDELSLALVNALAEALNLNNRGVRWKELSGREYHGTRPSHDLTDYYGVLRASRAKISLLIEHVFHTNYEDCRIYTEEREELARVTAQTIAKHFSLQERGVKLDVQRPTVTAPSPTVRVNVEKEYAESGRFYPKFVMKVRSAPSTTSQLVGRYDGGSVIPSTSGKYDRVTFANGYVWISYIARSGKRRYVAVRPTGKPRGYWGPCRAE